MNVRQLIKSIGKNTIVLSAFAFACFASMAAIIAAPNFSGEWKLNEQKSELGEFGARTASKTMKITGQADNIAIERTGTNMQGEATTTTDKWTFDGKETESTAFGNAKRKTSTKWAEDGKTLNVNSIILFDRDGQTTEIKVAEKWTLSEDGKTLTIESASSSTFGENKMKLIYDKTSK